MSESCIEFRHVSKSFAENSVLKSLSLKLPAKVTTAIVGESGSGKSTLIQLANGLLKPDAGSVSVLGTEITASNIIEKRLAVGNAVQGAGLFPHLSVRDNVTLMARLQRWPTDKINSRYQQLLELLALDDELSDRYPFSLSGGQQQRVSLCRAMMLNPPLLLLDEPFSALDPLTREGIHTEFLKLQVVEPRSMVLVTHDMDEALKLAEQIIVLRNGEVEQQASIEEIASNPATDYVESLFQARERIQ